MTALADGLKSDVVDSWARSINEGSGGVPFLWEEFPGGPGMSSGEVQVLEPEDIREPGDVQAPEDIRGSENVQEPENVYSATGVYGSVGVRDSEGIVSGEEKFSGADGVSWDEDVDPVEGSDVDFVGGE